MRRLHRAQEGQALVEFALIAILFFMFTAGLIDVGRAFYQYNAMASAARYAARWGSVVGGTCIRPDNGQASTDDWCVQLNASALATPAFWDENGNIPLQAVGTPCPTGYDSGFNGYYQVSQYAGSTSTTIIGAVAQRFDSNGSRPNVDVGGSTPGFDLSQLKACIYLDTDPNSATKWSFTKGARVRVYLYYPFSAVGGLFSNASFYLIASSQYEIE
jgi:hypothetical protein